MTSSTWLERLVSEIYCVSGGTLNSQLTHSSAAQTGNVEHRTPQQYPCINGENNGTASRLNAPACRQLTVWHWRPTCRWHYHIHRLAMIYAQRFCVGVTQRHNYFVELTEDAVDTGPTYRAFQRRQQLACSWRKFLCVFETFYGGCYQLIRTPLTYQLLP